MNFVNKWSDRKKSFFYMTLLLTAAMIWGLGFVVVKNSLKYMSVAYMLVFRFGVGFLGMSLISLPLLKQINLRYLLQGILLGGCMYIAYRFQSEAVKFTTVGKNAFLSASYVIFVPIFYWCFYHKKPTKQIVLATILMFTGIGVLSVDSSLSINFGDILTILCGFFFALHIVFLANFINKGSSPVLLNVLQLGYATLFALIIALLTEEVPKTLIQRDAIIGILYIGICCTMLAFLFQAIGQKHTNPSVASILLCTESVFGALFSTIFLSEPMTTKMFLGCTIIFISLILAQVKIKHFPKKKKGEVH